MAIRFFNIRSGLEAVAESEPHIAALWASSDHSPNITQGQDMGWRLAPEVAVELKKIKQDINLLQHIATRFNKLVDEVGEADVLTYISNKTKLDAAPVARIDDYQDAYDQQVRALEAPDTTTMTTTETTTEPPEDTTTTTTKAK